LVEPCPLTVCADAGAAVATTTHKAISTLAAVRRSTVTGFILACLLGLLWSSAASAHPGATVFTIQVGAPTSISIVVPADYGKVIDEVDVQSPATFEQQSAEPPTGWTVAPRGGALTFTGGQIAPYSYAVLAVRGIARAKGELLFPVTTHSPDGTVMRYDGHLGSTNAGAIVYAGVTPHLPSKGGFPWLTVGGGTAAGVGVAGTALLAWRRRRAGVMAEA
jgi:hypothetical protein